MSARFVSARFISAQPDGKLDGTLGGHDGPGRHDGLHATMAPPRGESES